MSTIGMRIKQKRLEKGMSQEELAKRMGYKSKSTINKIEKGINDIVQSNIVKFAEILGTTPAWLMGWEQNQIDAVSEIESDANTYEDAQEGLKSLYEEFGEMHLTASEISQLKSYAKIMRNQNINYGEVIKEARLQKGYTIEQLAEKIGVQPSEINAYEKSELFPANKLKEIYFALDVTYFMMLGIRQHFDETYQKIYSLELSSDELNEVYEYAKYIKAKRQ